MDIARFRCGHPFSLRHAVLSFLFCGPFVGHCLRGSFQLHPWNHRLPQRQGDLPRQPSFGRHQREYPRDGFLPDPPIPWRDPQRVGGGEPERTVRHDPPAAAGLRSEAKSGRLDGRVRLQPRRPVLRSALRRGDLASRLRPLRVEHLSALSLRGQRDSLRQRRSGLRPRPPPRSPRVPPQRLAGERCIHRGAARDEPRLPRLLLPGLHSLHSNA